MTRLTAEFKSDKSGERRRFWLRKPVISINQHTYTNFSGNYGESLSKEELSEDLKYAEAVRRQKFW